MSEYDAGEAFLRITPNFAGVVEAITREAAKWGVAAGRSFGSSFNDTVRRETNNAPLGPSDSTSARRGAETGGKFADAFRARLDAALRNLPNIRINADSSDADRKLADIRARMEALRNARIGVDITDAQAITELDRLRARLDEFARTSPSAAVRVDTAAARAELDRFRADLDRTDAKIAETKAAADSVSGSHSFTVTAFTGPAMAAIGQLRTALLALSAGAVITPLIGGAASLLGPLSVLGLGGGGALAASLPGLAAVKNVLSDQSQLQKNTGAAAQSSAQQQAGAAAQVQSAELSLQSTRQRIAANRITQAQQVAQAEHQVTTAEQQLTQAQQASLTATQQLTNARVAAQRGLQDSAFSVTDARLQLQQDQMALQQAQLANDAALASTVASPQQRQQAALALAQAQQALIEQQVTLTRAQQDDATVQKQGVDRSPQVVAAQQQQAQAAQQVTNAQYALKQAREGVANAQRQATQQQAQDAITLQQAELSLANAQRSQATAAAGSSTASETLAAALAKLTPAEQQLLSTVKSSKTAFLDFAHSVEPAVLPLFSDALAGIVKVLPILEPLIRAVASAADDMVRRFTALATGPGFKTFIATLTSLAGPTIRELGNIFANLAGAGAHLVEAFAPLSVVVLKGLDQLTGSLSRAAASPALHNFAKILAGLAPTIVAGFRSVGSVIGAIFTALAPLARPVFAVITTLAGALKQVIVGIGPALTQLFAALGPAVETVIKTLAPALTAVLQALGPALTALTPGLTALGSALAQGLVALTPALKPLGQLISAVVKALAPFLPLIGQLIGSLLPPLARFLTAVAVALQPVVTQLVHALAPVLPQLGAALGQFLTALTPILPMLAKLLLAVVPVLPVLLKLVAAILQMASKALPYLIDGLNLLMPILNILLVGAVRYTIDILNGLIKVIDKVGSWFGHLGGYARDAAAVVSSAWRSGWDFVKSVWDTTSGYLTSAWGTFTGTASRIWKDISSAVTSAWSTVGSALKATWRDVETVFVDGVNFITQDVVNPLVRVLNDVLGVFGVKVPSIPKLSISAPAVGSPNNTPQHGTASGGSRAFQTGGVLPGFTPGFDGIRLPSFLFSGGEGILVPEATRALGGAPAIAAINSMFSSRVSGPGSFSGGGILGSIWDGITSSIDQAKDWIRRGGADAAVAALKVAEEPIRLLLGDTRPFFKNLMNGFFDKVNSDAFTFIRGNMGVIGAPGPGTIPSGQHLALIQQALGIAKVPDTLGNEAAVNIIVDHESAWNPSSINNWDSNARSGDPSRGLMQTIMTTFESYRSSLLPDNIYNPLANLVAGIRYAVSRYGALGNVPGVEAVNSGRAYVGYDSGGFLPPGLTTVYNGTGRPEPVFTSMQWDELRAAHRGMTVNNHLYELPDAAAAATAVVRRLSMPGAGSA